ncbi:flagellar brake protein [candidate division KSB1 bacterium]
MDEYKVGWKYILEYFKIEPPSQETLYYSLIILVTLILIAVVAQIILQVKRARKRREREWNWFYKLAEAKDLSIDEMKALKHLAATYFPKDPQQLVSSIRLFDRISQKFLDGFTPWYMDYDKEETAELLDDVREKYFLKDFHAVDNLKSTREFPPGQRIRMTVETETHHRFLHTRVEKNSKNGVSLVCGEFAEIAHLLIPGALFTGYFWRTGDAGYQFPLRLLRKIDEETVEFSHTEAFTRKQRRHFFRVEIRLGGRFRKLSPEEVQEFYQSGVFKKRPGSETFLGSIISLSGGGLSFITEIDFKSGDLLMIDILSKNEVVFSDMMGRVVRIKDLDRRNKVFVEFIYMPEETRESIIQYVSMMQLEKKQKSSE